MELLGLSVYIILCSRVQELSIWQYGKKKPTQNSNLESELLKLKEQLKKEKITENTMNNINLVQNQILNSESRLSTTIYGNQTWTF